MKPFFFLFLMLFALISQKTLATCYPAGVTFSTQAQIDNFATSSGNCTEIIGDVTITGNDITNLTGLAAVSYIGGNLTIKQNPLLTSVSAMGSLQAVLGDFIIAENNTLSGIYGFSSLLTVGKLLSINSNPAMTNLAGFNGLITLDMSLNIYDNPNLVDISGFQMLKTVTSSFILFMLSV